jgi:hypothetical protein
LEVLSEFNRNLLGVSERKSRENALRHLGDCGTKHSSHQLPGIGTLYCFKPASVDFEFYYLVSAA